MFFQILLGFSVLSGVFNSEVSSGYWILTPTVREEFHNGSNGYCEYNDENSPICSTEWENLGAKDGKIAIQDAGCRYFKKTTTYVCRDDKDRSRIPREICERKVHFYQLRSECFGQWLSWNDCQANSRCGQGISWRYRFFNSFNFRYQTRSCSDPNCATWSEWREPIGDCDNTCTKMWTRNCMRNGINVASNQCHSGFSGALGNSTHQIMPCLKKTCSSSKIPFPFPLKINVDSFPNPAPPPDPTTIPTYVPRQADESESSLFTAETFWIGFFIGIGVAFALLLLVCCIYLNTWKGKVTIAAIKTYRQNEKRYYDRKRQHEHNSQTTPLNQASRIHSSYSRNSIGRESVGKAGEISLHSYSSWRKDEGYKSYPTSGSVSGHSIQPYYGTYYTPRGESKLRASEGRQSTKIIPSHTGRQYASKYDSYESESASESIYDLPRTLHDREGSNATLEVPTGTIFYEKHSGSRGQKHGERFDEDAYMKSYKAYRAERRRGEIPSKYGSRRSRNSRTNPRKQSASSVGKRSWKEPQEYRGRPTRESVQDVQYTKVMKNSVSNGKMDEKSPKPHCPRIESKPSKLHESYTEDIRASHHVPNERKSPSLSDEGLEFPPPPAVFYNNGDEVPM